MIAWTSHILFVLLVGGFPALCSMGLNPCCTIATGDLQPLTCCQHRVAAEEESSLPHEQPETCLCSLGFFAIQSQGVSPDPLSAGPLFDLSRWNAGDRCQASIHAQPASCFSSSGRLRRLQLSSLLC